MHRRYAGMERRLPGRMPVLAKTAVAGQLPRPRSDPGNGYSGRLPQGTIIAYIWECLSGIRFSMVNYDAIIIGSGQAANPLAAKLAAAGWKTALIEKKFIG